MTTTHEHDSEDIPGQAADLASALDGGPMTEELHCRLRDFASTSTTHRRELLMAVTILDHLVTPPAQRSQFRRLWLAAAVSAILAVVALWPKPTQTPLQPPLQLSTRTTESQVFHLPDGSIVDLGPASRVEARFESHRRDVTLLRGGGFFDVKHDPSKPFTVVTATARVVALGTEFGVLQNDADSTVVVRKGRVHVTGTCSAGQAGSSHSQGVVILGENEEAVVSSSGCRIAQKQLQRDDVQKQLSWIRILDFSGQSLSQAVADMSSGNRRRIVLDDASLASLRLGGRFELHDVAGFIGSLRRLGVQAAVPWNTDDDSSEIHLVRAHCRASELHCGTDGADLPKE